MDGTPGTVGSSCSTGNDCLFNKCVSSICVAPALSCPTSIPGTCDYASIFISRFLICRFQYAPPIIYSDDSRFQRAEQLLVCQAPITKYFTRLEFFLFLILRPCRLFYLFLLMLNQQHLHSSPPHCQLPFPGSICSQNGNCGYFDPSGNSLPACSILNITCSVLCTCYSGYGGKDCSLSSASLTARNNLRYLLNYLSCTVLISFS